MLKMDLRTVSVPVHGQRRAEDGRVARYQTGIETRERILTATRASLADVGLEGTTLKAICDRAGVGAGSFYNLFVSKEEAILAIVREAIEAVDPGDHDRDGAAETVDELVDAYLAFVTGQPDVARIYLQTAVAWGLNDPALAARFRRHQGERRRRLADALRRDRPELPASEARQRAEYLLATLNGLAMAWLLDPTVELDAHRLRAIGTAIP
jgi:TetR/AcrR family transcriptional regulator, transcriptional repressor of bet genes